MIRPAQPGDLQEILRVEDLCFTERNDNLLRRLCGVSDTFLVYDTEAGVRGYVLATLHSGGKARVASLAVHPEFQREGVASELMQEAMDRLCEKELRYVELEVRASNAAAQCLYLGLGFELAGVKPDYYVDGGDAYLMVRQL